MCALFLFRKVREIPFQKTDLHTSKVHPGSYLAVISGFSKKTSFMKGVAACGKKY